MSNTITDTKASATVSIGGGDTILCEVVYRCEGWVPRFTVSNGVPGEHDSRRQSYGQAFVTLRKFGVSATAADTLLTHVASLAEAKLA